MSLRVLLVDPSEDFLNAATRLLEGEGFSVVASVTDTDAALALADRLHPDIALVDAELARLAGGDLERRMAERSTTGGPRMVLTADEPSEAGDLITSGQATGLVAKARLSTTTVLEALGEGE